MRQIADLNLTTTEGGEEVTVGDFLLLEDPDWVIEEEEEEEEETILEDLLRWMAGAVVAAVIEVESILAPMQKNVLGSMNEDVIDWHGHLYLMLLHAAADHIWGSLTVTAMASLPMHLAGMTMRTRLGFLWEMPPPPHAYLLIIHVMLVDCM